MAKVWSFLSRYLLGAAEQVKVALCPAVVEPRVLLPNFFSYLAPVVHEAHESLHPETCRGDVEFGQLIPASGTEKIIVRKGGRARGRGGEGEY